MHANQKYTGAYSIEDAELREAVCKVFMNSERRAIRYSAFELCKIVRF